MRLSQVTGTGKTTNMTLRTLLFPAATLLLASNAVLAQVPAPATTQPGPDRAAAYYHDGLAHLYEELAVNNGRPDYAAQAVEEYKLALNADPTSKYLQDGLADLYFRIGRIREAVSAAQEQVKKDPNDLSAHTLLGKVYLRSLGDMQGSQSGEMLQLAIGEYEKLAQLNSKDLETHLILGQLYGLNHDSAKAEAQFKAARTIDGNSEDAVLKMAQLYTEEGQNQRALDALTAIPADDRSARIDFALGALYDQMGRPKDAAVAYKAALEEDGDNPDGERALATSLLASNQPDEALKVYQQLLSADPKDLSSMIQIAKIQSVQGHPADALATLKNAKALPGAADSLDLRFTEAIVYDSMGKYEQAATILQSVLTSTARADGKYTDEAKSNRATFLDRLAVVQKEQGKTAEAISTYKQIVAMGGDYRVRGYQGEVNVYTDARQWKDTLAVAAEAAKALPQDRGVQSLYAFELAANGQGDRALELADKQLDGSPADIDTEISISNINLELRRTPAALAALDKAEALATTSAQRQTIMLRRAAALDRDKQFAAAEAQYRKVLALDPSSAEVLNDFGFMLADQNDRVPEALKMIQQAVAAEPANGAYLDSLGWAYFRLGQYSLAETNLQKAIERAPSDPSIHDHLGQLYEKTGRLKLAVTQWERSMTEYARTIPADVDPADVAKVKRELEEARTKLARVGSAPSKKS